MKGLFIFYFRFSLCFYFADIRASVFILNYTIFNLFSLL